MAVYETFELNADVPLEKFEWDDIWFDHATDAESKRIIVFGDSISVNYRFPLIEALRGKFCVDNYGTSKAADNPFLKETMRLVMQQQKHDVIYFFSGHGSHQTIEEYEKNVECLVQWLLEDYPDKKLILSGKAYSSYPPKQESNASRNRAIERIAAKYNLPFDDLGAFTQGRADFLKEDKVHLNELGQCEVAKHIAQYICNITENKEK